jgi:hypothetical protein
MFHILYKSGSACWEEHTWPIDNMVQDSLCFPWNVRMQMHTLYLLIYVSMRKYCYCVGGKIEIEISTDLHIFSAPWYKRVVSVLPLPVCACMLDRFYLCAVLKSLCITGWCHVNINIVAPKIGAPKQHHCCLQGTNSTPSSDPYVKCQFS